MNHLAGERSPYLLQHAGNPVDWHPWGEEAFARARAEEKPIFLSIGYSTCHWCHVMAHESFENPAIAALLNESFIAIKVDREERPDVDKIYMSYVQALTGHGGWPLSAWLTPELKPFYGGTYFPPEDRQGRAGFPAILRAIARGWRDEREKLVAESERVLATLRTQSRAEQPASAPPGGTPAGDPAELLNRELYESASAAFEKCFQFFHDSFDSVRGGFGGAPKFPRASNFSFLFRCAALQGPESEEGGDAAHMVTHTLQQMARGGIHDHVGGGFHRYAVDEDWFVPHFEKMLYDQAQIAVAAIEAWQASGDERHAWLALDVFDYVLRDLAHPDGGFYSAEDADSALAGAEGKHAEGAFYVWTKAEIESALAPEDAALVCAHYGVRAEGNVPAARDPQGEFTGRNILAQTRSLLETAKALGLDPEAASDRLIASLGRLRAVRGQRPRPLRDDKILTAWNGLMISALARGAAVPAESLAAGREEHRAAAVRAAEFVERSLWDEARGVLFRAWREGRGTIEAFAEDYAYFIQGLLDLYEATFDLRWIKWAKRLQAKMDELFWDEAGGGYFNSAAGATDIVLRLKEDYDGAEPTPSSIAALNLLRLAGIFSQDKGYRLRALRTLEAFRPHWLESPHALPQMLCALELALEPPRHLMLAGNPASGSFRALADAAQEKLGHRRIVLALDGGAGQAWLARSAPWLADMHPVNGQATAYLCQEFSCQAPVTTAEELRKSLS